MEKRVFVYSYFKGHGDGLHLAYSDDGYRWTALNNDKPFLKPEVGIEKIIRDPCVIQGPDGKFHAVWTSGWNERGIGYATSSNLVDWSEQRYLEIMADEPKTRNCWAPEIFYDREKKQFLIYWSSTVEGRFPETQPYGDDGYNHRIFFTTTKNFLSFETPQVLYDGGFNAIDASIFQDTDKFILFVKDETLSPVRKNIRVAYGKTPYAFGAAGEPITISHYWAEGPSCVKIGNEYIVYFDKYKINQIGAVRSTDLLHWEDISHEIKLPHGAQHGFVFTVSPAVMEIALQRLQSGSLEFHGTQF